MLQKYYKYDKYITFFANYYTKSQKYDLIKMIEICRERENNAKVKENNKYSDFDNIDTDINYKFGNIS